MTDDGKKCIWWFAIIGGSDLRVMGRRWQCAGSPPTRAGRQADSGRQSSTHRTQVS
jgi:hypothetical protein